LVIQGSNVYRVISDHLGSVRAVVNIDDPMDVPARLEYEAFGSVSGTGVGFVPQGFAGGLYDADTALVRFGARDYDPIVGRWTAKDPIRFLGRQANLYVYVGSNPINWTDPQGREVLGKCWKLFKATGPARTWLTILQILGIGTPPPPLPPVGPAGDDCRPPPDPDPLEPGPSESQMCEGPSSEDLMSGGT
jgi:RHS repeat-associated protein